MPLFSVVVLATEHKKDLSLVWAADTEAQARTLVRWLSANGIKAKVVTDQRFFNDWL